MTEVSLSQCKDKHWCVQLSIGTLQIYTAYSVWHSNTWGYMPINTTSQISYEPLLYV